MNSPWEPGVAQAMQRHGGSNHSVPKVNAPTIQPDFKPPDDHPAMVQQDVPLAPVVTNAPRATLTPCASERAWRRLPLAGASG